MHFPFIFFLTFLPLLHSYRPRLCIHCTHFLTDDSSTHPYGFCKKYPKKEEDQVRYLVTGVKDPPNYYYCTTVRQQEEWCGIQGKDYLHKK